MKSLSDKQRKAILVNQRFHDVDDLGYVLQQDEDLAQNGSDVESDAEQDGHVRFDDEVEDIETGTPEAAALPRFVWEGSRLKAAPKTSASKPTITDEDIRNAVICVMEHSGWRPANPGWQSPRRQNPERNEFCSECCKFGHQPENC
ncbi:unnamed protein product [Phytophthora fragariaefolia]|uniref:Unnamed protein product n=1 Tax=Phytophthora fragariaefolia TaxID=1490495 RepID=A0A9W6XZV9_9STRA|nr:unnamed protein product [Phytophthora fragariaefolia]